MNRAKPEALKLNEYKRGETIAFISNAQPIMTSEELVKMQKYREYIVNSLMDKNRDDISNTLADAILYNRALTNVTYSDGEIKVENIPSNEWKVDNA